MSKAHSIILIISIILGLYILNGAFAWIVMPDFIINIGKYITALSGILLIILGIWLFKKTRNPYSV